MNFRFVLAGLAAAVLAGPAIAQADHGSAGHAGHAAGAVQTAQGHGVVKAIDAKAGTILIDHEPIAALKWPSMRMKFKVQSAALLSGVSVGRKVHFTLRNDKGKPVITALNVG